MAESKHQRSDSLSERYCALLAISEAIAAHRDIESIFRDLTERLRVVVDFDGILTVLHDPASGLMRMHLLESRLTESVPMPVELTVDESPGGWVWKTQQPFIVSNTDEETRFAPIIEVVRKNGVKSFCVLPLTTANRRLGALGFASLREQAYSESELEFLQQVANQVAGAIDNAINFESALKSEQELKLRLEQLGLLLDVNNSVVSQLDLRELFKMIASCLRGVIDHDAAGMTLYDSESGQLRVHALEARFSENPPLEEGELFPIEGTPGAMAFHSRRTVLVTRADLETLTSPLVQRILADGIQSGCVAPLISHNRVLGTLDLVSLREDAFTEKEAELLTQIAGQIALAVENALNFDSARRAEQQVARERDRWRRLLEINNAIVSHLNLSDLIKAVSDSLQETMSHDFMGVTLYDAERNCLSPFAYTGDIRERMNFIEQGMPVPLEGTPLGQVFTSGRPLLIEKPDPEKFHSDLAKRLMKEGVKSGCGVPLVVHGRKLGVLGIGSYTEAAFTQKDLEFLTQIAGQIAIAVENALVYREIESLKNKLNQEKLYLEEEISSDYDFEQIIGSSAALRKILKQVETVAPTDSTVLIEGETGTGKELIARAIHSLSLRRQRTMVKLNCAAIPTGLLESELFGHEKGAFTGAIARRIGRFELADKGTLFLDEVGEIPLDLQPKLLRVLQEQEFERLGSARTVQVDARMIAATNRDLEQMVADRHFRDDLYYRLRVFPITVPPLRERPEDIPALVRFFAGKFARRMKKRIEAISAEAVAALQEYRWPGNIRELENFIERAVILTEGAELQMPMSEIKLSTKPVAREATAAEPSTEKATLESIEREHILKALDETNWVIGGANGAASRLGLKRTTLQARMKKLGIARQN